jgi:hypothetical protein
MAKDWLPQLGFLLPDALTAPSLASVADNVRTFTVLQPCRCTGIGFIVTTAITVTPPVVDFDRRVLPGSDTGRVDKALGGAAFTFPAVAGLVAGAIPWKEIAPVDLNPGDQLTIQVTTAATAGAGWPIFRLEGRDEVPVNFPDYLAAT